MRHASRFILPIILLALTSAAEASDANMLIGKWAGPCNMANSESSEFTSTLSEFKSDGTAEIGNLVYGDSQCAGPVIRTEQKDVVSYSATDTTIQIDGNVSGRIFKLTAEYLIQGEEMTIYNANSTIAGETTDIPSTILKRVR